MSGQICCQHCRKLFVGDPRVKSQSYCGQSACQRARKTAWEREKLALDPDYLANRRESQRKWRERNPGYYRRYREKRPNYRERNRLLERVRKAVRRGAVAKMDASKCSVDVGLGVFYLVPLVAKMDALPTKIFAIPFS